MLQALDAPGNVQPADEHGCELQPAGHEWVSGMGVAECAHTCCAGCDCARVLVCGMSCIVLAGDSLCTLDSGIGFEGEHQPLGSGRDSASLSSDMAGVEWSRRAHEHTTNTRALNYTPHARYFHACFRAHTWRHSVLNLRS